jgi:ATP-dependent RNA helicase DeaD
MLSRLDLAQREPQALVLVPTRELAIQVAEAFQKYAAHLRGFHVHADLRRPELHRRSCNALRRGAHVIVGTPGRDDGSPGARHFVWCWMPCASSCSMKPTKCWQMGFVDAIDTILSRAPRGKPGCAVLQRRWRRRSSSIAQRHLRCAQEITISEQDHHGRPTSISAIGS